MLAIEPSTRLKMRLVASAFSSSSSGTVIAKSFLGWNWWSMLSMARAVRLTFSIESTATVTCDSSIRSTVYDPCFSVERTSPKRARSVVRGMYTSLLKSWAARLEPVPADEAFFAVTPTIR